MRQSIRVFEKAERDHLKLIATLRRSETFFRILAENANEAILMAQDGMLQYANTRATRITGYSKKELCSRDLIEFIHPLDQDEFSAHVNKLSTKTAPKILTFRILDKTGNTRWLETITLRIMSGKKSSTFYFFYDVTEKKAIENALRESEEKYRQLFEYAPAGIYEVDLTTGKFINVNDVMCEYTGYTKQEFLTMKIWDILKEDSLKQSLERFDKQQKGEPIPDLAEYEVTCKNDKKLWALVNTRIEFENDQPSKATVVAHDITERKKIEQELSKTQKLESLGVLAGGIAHDFNNILSGIMGNISLAKFKAEHGEDNIQLLDEALRASSSAQGLTQQLLVFSKGGAPIKKAASISEILRESSAFALRGSKVRCEFNIDEGLWPIRVDVGQFNQVIHNLLINAKQAMPDGGTVEIFASNIVLSPEDDLPLTDGNYIKISIQDQGIGMSEEQISKIFDPYFTTKNHGSGLGLTMTYTAISRHDGYITVESEKEKGATFHIYLPAVEKAEDEKIDREKRSVTGQGNILVMDDEEMVRQVTEAMLSTLGYDVRCARNGSEAITLYEEVKQSSHPFDAIIMDLTIPGELGGKETIARLLKIDPSAKVIVSSGYSNDPVIADFEKYGFKGVVTKPYGIDELGTVLRHVLTDSETRT